MHFLILLFLTLGKLDFCLEQNPYLKRNEHSESLQVHDRFCQLAREFSASENEIAKRVVFTQTLVSILKQNNFSKEVVQKVLNNLFNSGHIHLIRPDFGRDEQTLNDLLQMNENQWIRLVLTVFVNNEESSPESDSYNPEEIELCNLEITALILENISRPERKSAGYTQKVSKGVCRLDLMNPASYFIENEGYPSLGDDDKKGVPCRFLPHCANLGVVKRANGHCVITRSAKANSQARMLECVVHACLEQLRSPSPQGFEKRADGTLEFQHVITSYINTLVCEKKDKSRDLLKIMQAIDEWPQEGILTIVDGKTIILLKPIFQNQMFSTILESLESHDLTLETSLDRTDYITFIGNQRLLAQFISKKNIPISASFLRASENLDRLLQSIRNENTIYLGSDGLIDWQKISIRELYLKRSQFFKSETFKEYQKEVAKLLIQEKDKGTLSQALFAVMFRRDMPEILEDNFSANPPYNKVLHAADIDLYRNILCQAFNLSQGKQCARGLDRTGIGVALAVAQDRYLQNRDAPFFPHRGLLIKGSEEHKNFIQFKRYFRDALKNLCVPVGVESRGKSGITSIKDDNPITRKYLINNEDIGFGAPQVKEEEVDVYNLSYQDLALHGKKQYKGLFTEKFIYSIPGQHIKKTEVMVAEASKKITPAIHEHVENKIKAILAATEWEGTTRPILNSSLELAIPASELHLNEIVGKTTRLQLLDNFLKTMDFSKDKYGSYVLSALLSIINLGNQ